MRMKKISLIIIFFIGFIIAGYSEDQYKEEKVKDFMTYYINTISREQAETGVSVTDGMKKYYYERKIPEYWTFKEFEPVYYIFDNALNFSDYKVRNENSLTICQIYVNYTVLGKVNDNKIVYYEKPIPQHKCYWINKINNRFYIYGDSYVTAFHIFQKDLPVLRKRLNINE